MSGIEDYGLIGNLHTAALVARNGSIDWLCVPSFDSPACFAALLDTPEAGRWLVAPVDEDARVTRSYHQDTLVLESVWTTGAGSVRVTDFMPMRHHGVRLVRILECLAGSVRMTSELVIRFEYGHIVPWVRPVEGGLRAVAGPDSAELHAPQLVEAGRVLVQRGGPEAAQAAQDLSDVQFTVKAGDRVEFTLIWSPSHEPPPATLHPRFLLNETLAFWRNWSSQGKPAGRWTEAVQRSLITLKGLTYAPTGGIVAAPTTSLPEQLGGPRNWDYRYCWLRDASLTLEALIAAGYTGEANAWRGWLLRAVAGDPADLQIVYGIDGRRRLPEWEVDWLSGYEGARPVRVGNAAAAQLQLDVWGEVLDGLAYIRGVLGTSADAAWPLQVAIMEHLESIWEQVDQGMCEMRGPARHFTHSKVMAAVAADRMAKAVDRYGLPGRSADWRALRDRIRAEVLARGYDARRNTFVQSFDGTALDASLLTLPRVGFIAWEDPRFIGTVEAIQRELTEDGLVLRYRPEHSDDGLPGTEGVFLACSFWLVDALAGMGRGTEARDLFERLLDLRNDLGLLSEEWSTRTGRQLGNVPQAFSHLSLVSSAYNLVKRMQPPYDHRLGDDRPGATVGV